MMLLDYPSGNGIADWFSAICGFATYSATHKRLLRQGFSEEQSISAQSRFTPGYSKGIGSVLIPSLLCAGTGFGLAETHATACFGVLSAAAMLLSAFHHLRFRTFGR